MKFWLTAFGAMMLFCPVSARAADATSFDPLTVSVEALAISGVPVGTIIAWPGANNPEGWAEGNWLECNGQTISQAVYPELFAVMGGQVPDLRGLFLRGTGGNAAPLGTVQGDAIRNITGTFVTDFNSADYSRYMSGAFDATNVPGLIRLDGNVSHTDKLISFNVSRVVPTANENRPINRSVRYLVRARP